MFASGLLVRICKGGGVGGIVKFFSIDSEGRRIF
jgi:hypothetical protein